MTVIKVGYVSKVEVNERKYHVVDTLNTTHTVVEDGFVIGGGMVLLYCSSFLDEITKNTKNMDQCI